MALVLNVAKGLTIEVICRRDSAITNRDGYDDYIESFGAEGGPHEDHLKLREGDKPTRFVLKRQLPFKVKQQIRGENFRVKEGGVEMNVNFMTEMVRAALVDIKDGDDLKARLKRGKDGFVDGEFISLLEQGGVMKDLIAAFNNANAEDDKEADDQKNS